MSPTPCSCNTFPSSLGNVTFEASVGIGTATPGTPLEVDGDRETLRLVGQTTEYIGFFGGSTPYAYLGVGQNGTLLTGADANSLCLRANTSLHLGSGGDGLTLTVTGGGGGHPGSVGIGTTAPGTPLEVDGDRELLRLGGQTTEYIGFFGSGSPYAYLGIGQNGTLLTGAGANSLCLRANTSLHLGSGGDGLTLTVTGGGGGQPGNVGIGTTSPQQRLDVNGNINTSGSLLAGGQKVADSNGCYYA